MESNFCKEAYDWLDGNQLSYDIWNKKYRYNNENFEEWLDRVSGGKEHIRNLIKAKKFLFGGRTLANRGTDRGSYSNCYSHGYIEDSLEGIMDAAKNIAMTFKAQGGQGLSLSKIRPKGSMIAGKFKSDGIVPFMEIFNTVTESVSQGGSRKGALLMSLNINHPEAETFMTIKSDLKKINKANLSVEIDDTFMKKVEAGDTEASRLFNILCEQACKYAEPGVIFTNKFRNYNLMEFVDSYQIETCNPCGEQPLAKHSACNLCSINLSEYVLNPFTQEVQFDWDSFTEDIDYIVEAMDDIIDENLKNHALEEQRNQVAKYRNLGIGIMGIHDMFIKYGFKYGDPLSKDLLKNIVNVLFRTSVLASAKWGMLRGNFPGYRDSIWEASILKKVFKSEEIKDLKKNNYLRNCSLLSVAPCGSIGTMLNVSTGIEPWFSTHYIRNTKSLNGEKEQSYTVWAPVVKQAMDKHWFEDTIVTANDLNYMDRISVQAIVQDVCDTAISSTLNLPKDTTPEDIKKIYMYAWKMGLKGVTVYVDGSRDPILTTNLEESKSKDNKPVFDTITPISRKTFGTTYGATHCKKCACGTLYITTNLDKDGNLVEVFTHTSKGGICQANLNAVTRMISLGLRSGIKIEEIEDQLKGIHCPACQMIKAKGNHVDGLSCPDITAKTIKEFVSKGWKVCKNTEKSLEKCENTDQKPLEKCENKCPECGESIINTGGCISCPNCGYSKCG